MSKPIDAHMHFNHKADDPVSDLLMQISSCNLSGCVLILNTDIDKMLYHRNQQAINDNYTTIWVSYLLDIMKNDIQQDEWIGASYIKIHPRLSRITTSDFCAYADALKSIPAQVVTIDCFTYGHELSHHVSMEMTIFLAERFPRVKFIIAHGGGVDLLKCILITKTLPNIYYDLSLTCNYLWDSSVRLDMVQMVKFHANRVLFGSDYPDFTPTQAIERINNLCDMADLAIHDRQLILRENALLLYG